MKSDRIAYSKALTIAQEYKSYRDKIAVAFAGAKKTLLQRITRLNSHITMKTNLFEKLTAGVLILSAFLFLSFIIDGSNAEIKEFNSAYQNVEDSSAMPNADIVIIHKTNDKSGNKNKTVRAVKLADTEDIDSLITTLHTIDLPDDEVEKVIELALCEPDLIDCESIISNIHIALQEIDMAEIEREIKKAEKEITKHAAAIEHEYRTQIKHIQCDSVNEAVMLELKEAMAIARKELENLNVDSIVSEAMKAAHQSISDLDIELIVADAMEEAQEALENEQVKVIKIKKEFGEKAIDLSEHEKSLKEKEAELKQQLDELEDQLKAIKQKRKEESK